MTDAVEYDLRGLICPLPVLRLRKRTPALAAGTVVTVLADDPAAVIDIPHFCAEAGHAFLDLDALDGAAEPGKSPHRFRLRIGG